MIASLISRRSLLAAVPATAALAAVPDIARASTAVPDTVTLRPRGTAVLTFPLAAPGYQVTATVRTTPLSWRPFVAAVVSWPSGPSQSWTLCGSHVPGGQGHSGSGPASGKMTVTLTSWDATFPMKVAFSVVPLSSAPEAHVWDQVTNRPMGVYPLGSSDFASGVVVGTRTAIMGPADMVQRFMPLRPGPATLSVTTGTSAGEVVVSTLDPALVPQIITDLDVAVGRTVPVSLVLPPSPCLLNIRNASQRNGRFEVSVKSA